MSGSSSIRNFIPMQNKYDRVVLLVDMDCFYCQVEEKLNPELKGLPIAVVQYNAWRGGGIIAVNYPARAKGVTRHMRGDEAMQQCPDIQLVKVPNVREKADLTKFREAGKEVANVLQKYTQLLERASVDEAYLDITEAVNKRLDDLNKGLYVLQPERLLNTYAVGFQNIGEYVTSITARFANPDQDFTELNLIENDAKLRKAISQSDIKLLIGASVSNEIRAEVKEKTGYECSAGIAHNKILAKLACGINKPNKQTLLPLSQIPKYFETLPIRKIKGLGAKFGEDVCERLKIQYLGSMLKYTEAELQKMFDEKNGSWLYQICRGIDLEAITPRFYSKSIGCCKKFPGLNNITGLKTLNHWLNELANEISDRLQKDIIENNRKARQMVVSFVQDVNGKEIHSSRSCPLTSYDQKTLAQQSLEVIKTNTKTFFRSGSEAILNNPIRFLGISVGKFETISNAQSKIETMFKNQTMKSKPKPENLEPNSEALPSIELQQSNEELQKSSKNSLKSFFTAIPANKSDNADYSCVSKDIVNNDIPKTEPDLKSKKKSFLLEYLKKNSNLTESITLENHSETSSSTIIQKNDCEETKKISSPLKRKGFFLNILKKENNCNHLNINEKECNIKPNSLVNQEKDDRPNQLNEIETEMPATSSAIFDNNLQNANKRKHPDDATTSVDYKATYAEFAVPIFNLNVLDFIKCEICGVQVPNIEKEIQTHQDHHVAQELYQQQSEEYRAEMKNKIASNKSLNQTIQPNKKIKTNNSSKNNNAIKADITQFLKPNVMNKTQINQTTDSTISELNSTILDEDPDSLLCTECNKVIKNCDEAEHKDYHIAKELQKQLNQVEARSSISPSSTSNKPRKSIKPSKPQHNNVKKPISQYFSKN